LAPAAPAAVGAYVALLGPQFETEAEVAWLRGFGAVVGMSAAVEVRAAADAGLETLVLGLVANRAADIGSHDDVLAAGARMTSVLARSLLPALAARWPGLI
jgi:purine-nucleoside phosphorylase